MAEAEPVTDYRVTEHARDQMVRRQISEEDVASVLADPEQISLEILDASRHVTSPSRIEYQVAPMHV